MYFRVVYNVQVFVLLYTVHFNFTYLVTDCTYIIIIRTVITQKISKSLIHFWPSLNYTGLLKLGPQIINTLGFSLIHVYKKNLF